MYEWMDRVMDWLDGWDVCEIGWVDGWMDNVPCSSKTINSLILLLIQTYFRPTYCEHWNLIMTFPI